MDNYNSHLKLHIRNDLEETTIVLSLFQHESRELINQYLLKNNNTYNVFGVVRFTINNLS